MTLTFTIVFVVAIVLAAVCIGCLIHDVIELRRDIDTVYTILDLQRETFKTTEEHERRLLNVEKKLTDIENDWR